MWLWAVHHSTTGVCITSINWVRKFRTDFGSPAHDGKNKNILSVITNYSNVGKVKNHAHKS